MGKRILIALLVTVGIGSVLFFRHQPGKGTARYHVRGYYLGHDRWCGRDWRSRAGDWVDAKMGVKLRFLYVSKEEQERLSRQMGLHVNAVARLVGDEAVAREFNERAKKRM